MSRQPITAETRVALAQVSEPATALDPELRLGFVRLTRQLDRVDQAHREAQEAAERYRLLLDRTLGLVMAQGVGLVASEALDVMILMTGAQRGFLGMVEGRGWRLIEARAMTLADVEAPGSEVSSGVIEQALRTGRRVHYDDALEALAQRGSVRRLNLRSVVCLPILQEGRALGFVYLDHTEESGRFDEAALSALTLWLPVVAAQLRRAAEAAEEDPFPGFVTRSAPLLTELRELARLARFDVPVLITGENLPLRKSRTPPAGPSSRRGAACPSASRSCRPHAGCVASRARAWSASQGR